MLTPVSIRSPARAREKPLWDSGKKGNTNSFNPLPCASKGETFDRSSLATLHHCFNPLPCASKGETGRLLTVFGVIASFNPLPCASKGETGRIAGEFLAASVSIRSPARAREKRRLTVWPTVRR